MRTQSSQEEGPRLQSAIGQAVERSGQQLMVTPSPTRAASGMRARWLYALIEPPNANDVGHIRVENDLNAASPMPLIFTFAGGSGVRENDRVGFNGFTYVLFNALPQIFQGVVVGIRCVGLRR